MDHFCSWLPTCPSLKNIPKRDLVAKTFDVLGWFAPTTMKVKILLQRLGRVDWDDLVPEPISGWNVVPSLTSWVNKGTRCLFPIAWIQWCIWKCLCCISESQTLLAEHKSHPRQRLPLSRSWPFPCWNFCGAYLLAQLLFHIRNVFNIPLGSVYV